MLSNIAKGFTDVIKAKDNEVGDYPALPGWTQSNHLSP